ncbi:MAG: Yip1 family protein [Chloroflexota bacterium]
MQEPLQPLQPIGEQSFIARAIGVLKLDKATYRSIREDDKALGQAWIIVILAGILNGIGSARQVSQFALEFQRQIAGQADAPPIDWDKVNAQINSPGTMISTIISTVIGLIITWLIFSAIARWVSRTFFGAPDGDVATMPQMMRLIGWAYVPTLLAVFGVIPVIGGILLFILAIWGILTQVNAVQAGTELSTGKSWGTWIVTAILPGILIGAVCCVVLSAGVGIAALFGGGS